MANNFAVGPRLPRDCTFTSGDWHILSRYWHPVAFSREVGEAPLAVRLLDEDLVVYRTSSEIVVAKDICLHRGAKLSLGRLDGDDLVCGYHGWRYASGGQCVRIPSQPERIRISKNARLFTFAAAERYGLVWVRLAPDAGEPDLPEWPEAEDPAYRVVPLPPLDWSTSSAREVDNFTDVSHFSFVHAASFGNGIDPEVPEVKVDRTATGIRYDFSYVAYNTDTSPVSGAASVTRYTTTEITLPFSVRLKQHLPERGDAYYAVFNTSSPVSARKSRTFVLSCRNYNLDVPDDEIREWECKVMAEDQRIVESQRPEELPLNLHEELHVRADRVATAYRHALTDLGLGSELTA